jgi:hypothetical protein
VKKTFFLLALAALASGCLTDYRWTSPVPEKMRTVSVPVFRNESDVTELGTLVSRQLLREFQREGTFSLRRVGDAAVEVQGVVKSAGASVQSYDRKGGMRRRGYRMQAVANVSVIDKVNGKVVIDNREYTASVTFAGDADNLTSSRDASGRLADELSRQIVDDVLAIKW